jgi:hypothetical protein
MPGVLSSSELWLAMIPKNESPDGFAGECIASVKSGKIGEG